MSNIRKCVAIHFEWESHGREANATRSFSNLKKSNIIIIQLDSNE